MFLCTSIVKAVSLLFLFCFGNVQAHPEGVERREDHRVVNRIFFAHGKCIGVIYDIHTKEFIDFGLCWKNDEEDYEVGDGHAKGIAAHSEGTEVCFQTTAKYLTFSSTLVESRPVNGVLMEVVQDRLHLLLVKKPVKRCYGQSPFKR